ncbi:MAG: hypothetical protein IKV83_04245 [Muribaculaceae bacterium]|nr:hypothetical protein [Muribaculaceae bacterium]
MKKTLRNLMLAGAAALLATGASAQTLEKVWEKNSGIPGAAGGGDMRFMTCDKDGKILVTDKAAKKIKTFNALFGAQDYLDIAPIIEEHYGTTSEVIDRIDTTVVEGVEVYDTIMKEVKNVPGAGTLIASDDAGNILINTNFPNAGSATDFIIIDAKLKNTYKLQITMPEGANATRCDNMGRIVGNMLSEEGAYMWLCLNNDKVAIIKVVNGEQDMEYSQASTACAVAVNTSCVAQPVYNTVAEIDALMDDNGDLTTSYWFRNRSYSQNVYQWSEDGTEQTAIALTEATEAGSTTKNASQEGFEVFTLQGETYFVVPMTTDGTTNGRGSNWGIYRASDQKLVAAWEENPQVGKGQGMGGFYVKPVDETSVHISHFLAGTVVGNYLFTVPKAEEPTPEPTIDPLYVFGSFQGWTPAEALELAYAEGVYTIEDIEFAEGGNFGLSSVKSDDWAAVNAARYGFATDNAKAVVGENEIVKGEGAIQVPYAGVWDITVDLANLKLTLATETPEPTPEPEPIVVPAGFNKVWEATTGIPGSASGGEFRFATARDGKILVTDKANKKIMAIDEEGMSELFDLAEAFDTHYGVDVTKEVIDRIDTTVVDDVEVYDTIMKEETTRTVPGAATGITVDDAGNILVGTGFPNAASSTDFIIISADLQETYKLKVELPEGVSANRIDQYGKVVGDMLSEEGAYLWLAINAQTKVAIVKIANGEQVADYTQASAPVKVAMNSSTLAQPSLFTVEEIDALMDELGDLTPSFWSRNRGSAQTMYGWDKDDATAQTTLSLTENGVNGETTKGAGAEGFATFKIADVTYFVVPMSLDGAARSAAIGVYDETGKLHATWTPEGVATGMGQMGSIAVETINEEAVAIYRFIPGVIAAKYTFCVKAEEPFEGPAELYMVGHDNNWDPANPTVIAMTETAGVYEAVLTFANKEFKFSEVKGTLDEFNAKAICIANDATVELDQATPLYKYAGSNCKANIATGKEYKVTIDLNANTITISESTAVEGIEVEEGEAVYYNLQGVKVANPENGVFIKVQGNKASKVLVK